MNILILHRIPYHKISYHRGIDHEQHHVVYLGVKHALANIPEDLPCEKWERPGVDRTDAEVISILKSYDQSFDRVISLSEYELMSAAIVREHFNISGATVAQVEKVRNKLIMKKAVASFGLLVPHNLSLADFISMESEELWHGKTVIKPVDGASSENVKVYDCPKSLRDAIRNKSIGIEQLDLGDYSNYEVEEFVLGDILHVDGLVFNGKLKLAVASRYIGNCLDFAQGLPLGSIQIDTTNAIRQWTADVLKATDLNTGSFHLEAINVDGKLIFLEVANRVGGADVVDAIELATGVHLPSTELRAYLGEKIESVNVLNNEKKYGWFVFPGHHLDQKYCAIKHAEKFKDNKVVVRWNQLSEEQPLTKHITYQSVEVPIAGVVGANTSEELNDFLCEMFSVVIVS